VSGVVRLVTDVARIRRHRDDDFAAHRTGCRSALPVRVRRAGSAGGRGVRQHLSFRAPGFAGFTGPVLRGRVTMTTTRYGSAARVAGAALSLVLGLGLAVPAAAQEDSRWLAWTGCWEPTAAEPTAGVAGEPARAYVVCVAPAENGARFST